MVFFLRENDDEVLEGNRYYWKISKLLQDMSSSNIPGVVLTFKLHSKIWRNSFQVASDGFFYLITSSSSKYFHDYFDLRAGIVGDNLKEIAAVSFHKLISRSELDSILLSNKVLYLFSEIRPKHEVIQKMKDCKEQTETVYRNLLLSGKNSDVILEVKDKKFYCHRCILAARSPVFAAMMKNDMEEGASGNMIIEDADPNVFKKFLLFLYTGKEDYLSWQNVTDLYKLANKYAVEDIKNVCRDDIKENIRRNNFFELFKFSVLLNDSELVKMTVKYFLENSEDIVSHENWITFLCEDSNKWLSVDHIKEIITAENFFFFFRLSKIQNHPELTETTIQFFLKMSNEIVRCENWLTLQSKNPIECNVLIRILADKYINMLR